MGESGTEAISSPKMGGGESSGFPLDFLVAVLKVYNPARPVLFLLTGNFTVDHGGL